MKPLKACILAAGEGKRLAPLTETRPKPLIPIAGKPLLQHTIEMLRENGIKEILLVVGYLKEQVQEYFKDGKEFGVELTYIEQKEFLGTGHATNLAKEFAQNTSFLLIYGDLFMDAGVFKDAIDAFNSNDYQGIITAMEVPDPTKYGILKIDESRNLQQIVEKPSDDRYGNLANAGVYIFSSEIFQGIAETEKSQRGEYELTESIERCVKKGSKYHVVDISNYYWSDVGHPWQLLDATHHVFDSKLEEIIKKNESPDKIENIEATIENFVTIHGYLKIGKGSIIKSGTYIEGPVFIGENCTIGPNAYLRPYTSIGNNCKIGNATEIKASIIMDNSSAAHLSYIGDSIIGQNVNIGCGSITANVRLDKKNVLMTIKTQKIDTYHRKLGAIIGDNASLGIQVSIMPGKIIGSHSYIGSNTIIKNNVPKNSILYIDQHKILTSKLE